MITVAYALLFFICCMIVFAGIVGIANANMYNIIHGLSFRDNPNVCIMLPDKSEITNWKEIRDVTIDSVFDWQHKLERSGGDWAFHILIFEWYEHADKHTSDFEECNIFIVFEKFNDNDNAIGTTSFDFSKSWHKWAFITVYTTGYNNHIEIDISKGLDHKIELNVHRENFPIESIERIVKHEFGHGIGLEHYYNTLSCPESCESESIMYHSFDPFSDVSVEITDLDIEMVYLIYGESGFKYPFPDWIPFFCGIDRGAIVLCD